MKNSKFFRWFTGGILVLFFSISLTSCFYGGYGYNRPHYSYGYSRPYNNGYNRNYSHNRAYQHHEGYRGGGGGHHGGGYGGGHRH